MVRLSLSLVASPLRSSPVWLVSGSRGPPARRGAPEGPSHYGLVGRTAFRRYPWDVGVVPRVSVAEVLCPTVAPTGDRPLYLGIGRRSAAEVLGGVVSARPGRPVVVLRNLLIWDVVLLWGPLRPSPSRCVLLSGKR